MANILSGKELSKYRDRVTELPQKGGHKDYAPDGTWLQDKKLQKLFEARHEVLKEEKVVRIGALCQGEWKPEKEAVELKQAGKFFHHMGYAEGDQLYLCPEEALFLMETCALEVYYGGLPLSIQQAYEVFLSDSISLEEYQTYSYLSRLGYILMRHSGPSSVTAYERQIRLDQHITDISYSKKRKINDETKDQVSKSKKIERSKEQIYYHNEETETNSRTEGDSFEGQTSVIFSPGGQPISSEKQRGSRENTFIGNNASYALPHTKWDFDVINIPNVGAKDLQSNVLHLTPPQENFLPPGIKINPKSLSLDLQNYVTGENDEGGSIIESQTYSLMNTSTMKSQVKAKNWSEYKENCRKMVTDFRLVQSPVGKLWKGEVTPLITPDMAISTGTLLKHLQVIENVHPNKMKKNQGVVNKKISFDVFKPDSKFKKSQPGLPDHRICVVSCDEEPPTLVQLVQLQDQCRDGVPLHWSVVDHGDIAFYKYNHISLPVDVTMG